MGINTDDRMVGRMMIMMKGLIATRRDVSEVEEL